SALYGDVLVETDTRGGPEKLTDDRQPMIDDRLPIAADRQEVKDKKAEMEQGKQPETTFGRQRLADGAANLKPGTPTKFLGSNGKNIVVLVRHTEVPFLPDGELAFLTNILSACRLGLGDVAIANVSGMEAEGITQVMDSLSARNVLLFGIAPLETGLPIAFPHFQAQQFNKRTYLYSPTLAEIENDKNFKAKLWASLKNLFAI
ncbi:MAG TPA: hypothetical protein VGB46_01935, partial [Flavisolibacter sp.]